MTADSSWSSALFNFTTCTWLCRHLLGSAMPPSCSALDFLLVATAKRHVGAAQECQQRFWEAQH